MTAEEIARKLADTFREAGYPYCGEPEVQLDGDYPLVIIWDNEALSTLVIACTANRHDYNAKRFAEYIAGYMETHDLAPCGAIGYFAHPAATDPTAVMVDELIWHGEKGDDD